MVSHRLCPTFAPWAEMCQKWILFVWEPGLGCRGGLERDLWLWHRWGCCAQASPRWPSLLQETTAARIAVVATEGDPLDLAAEWNLETERTVPGVERAGQAGTVNTESLSVSVRIREQRAPRVVGRHKYVSAI